MSLPKIYTYNLNPVKEMQIKSIANARGYVMINVPLENQNLPIFLLIRGETHSVSGNCFTEEMLLLENFEGNMLDSLLSEMKETGVAPTKYKAVVTDFNKKLTSYQLFGQLKKEAEEIKAKLQKKS